MKCENRDCGSNVNGWCQFEADGDSRPSFCSLHELVSLREENTKFRRALDRICDVELSNCGAAEDMRSTAAHAIGRHPMSMMF